MSINARIKEVRQHLKMNQEEFGKSLGVRRDVIKNYDIGRVAPTQIFINHLCSTHGVNSIWLETGEGEMFRSSTMSEDLAEFVGEMCALPDNSFKKRFAHALARLTEDDWEGLEHFIDGLLENTKKDSE